MCALFFTYHVLDAVRTAEPSAEHEVETQGTKEKGLMPPRDTGSCCLTSTKRAGSHYTILHSFRLFAYS